MADAAADPLLAVVAPPRRARFRELAGLAEDEPVSADFTGWSKRVLLTHDRAFLFPRDHTQVTYLEREVEALRAIADLGLREVPRLIDVWDDPSVSAYPVAVVSRLPGASLDDRIAGLTADELGGVLEQLAQLAARWHEADPGPLAARPARTHPPQAMVDALLGANGAAAPVDEVVEDIAGRLSLDAAARGRLAEVLHEARGLPLVLVHGDIHEGQVLVDADLRVTGVFDWQTARVSHPFTEFDLGEWGTGTWRHHRASFPGLRRRQWDAYATERGLPDDLGWCFDVFWAIVHALRWPESPFAGSDVTGPREEAMATARRALHARSSE